MADPNAQWAAFCSLLDIDASQPQNSGSNAAAANNLKLALTNYMFARFHTGDIRYLVDIVNAQGVIDAVVTNLGHISADDAAIKAADDLLLHCKGAGRNCCAYRGRSGAVRKYRFD